MTFASKLKGLLDYYLESRHVYTLCELLVCDRLKTVLSEGCLWYVLSVESANDDGWLKMRALTKAIDRHASAHTGDKPRVFAVGQNPHRPNGHTSSGLPLLPRPPPPKFAGGATGGLGCGNNNGA